MLPLEEVNRLLALHGTGGAELPDIVRFRVGDWDVDLFVCKDAYDRTCLDRAVRVELDGIELRVVTAEDLLIHKMIMLRTDRRRILQDVADLRAVADARRLSLDWSYLEASLPVREHDLLRDIASLMDDELIARLLDRASPA